MKKNTLLIILFACIPLLSLQAEISHSVSVCYSPGVTVRDSLDSSDTYRFQNIALGGFQIGYQFRYRDDFGFSADFQHGWINRVRSDEGYTTWEMTDREWYGTLSAGSASLQFFYRFIHSEAMHLQAGTGLSFSYEERIDTLSLSEEESVAYVYWGIPLSVEYGLSLSGPWYALIRMTIRWTFYELNTEANEYTPLDEFSRFEFAPAVGIGYRF